MTIEYVKDVRRDGHAANHTNARTSPVAVTASVRTLVVVVRGPAGLASMARGTVASAAVIPATSSLPYIRRRWTCTYELSQSK
ncbi:hypothetical protein [Mycobacterium sp. E2327]|uniref:hypothetical protein n=1 Tax=Mycobacterium sp. E2327 TaxID=1834132 RepID=UPI0018D399F2|nr:hypothetical protein [Mycobacterium sp. E2327]